MRSSGRKSRLSTDISSVIQPSRCESYRQKCWCESMFIGFQSHPATRTSTSSEIWVRDDDEFGKPQTRPEAVHHSAAEIQKTSINGVIHSCNKRSLPGTQEKSQRSHLVGFRHPPDRLCIGQLPKDLLLPAWV